MEAVTSGGGAASLGYPDSVDSSPRSRGGESWDEPYPSSASAAGTKIRVMCSYGGRIVPRPTDKSLCYLGGETRMVAIDRASSLGELSSRLSRTLLGGSPFTLKYQLPNEDLDSLISVTADEDLDNMIEEYDRIAASASGRASRLRLFLFPSKSDSAHSSIGSLLDDSKSETWFVDALNGAMSIDGLPRDLSTDVNCLLGLDADSSSSSLHSRPGAAASAAAIAQQPQIGLPRPDSSGKIARLDVHSVPDSPMLDTTSSFGSTSSAPCLSNLPPIRVRADDRLPDPRIAAMDDHFAHMNISAATVPTPATAGQEMLKEMGFDTPPPPPPPVPLPTGAGPTPTISPTENSQRVVFSSDDDKSDHGGTRNVPPRPPSPQQQKPTPADALVGDTLTRPIYYQDRSPPDAAAAELKREQPVSDPSYRGYLLPQMQQQEQLQQQQHHHYQQQQLHQQQLQRMQQLQQQQQQQQQQQLQQQQQQQQLQQQQQQQQQLQQQQQHFIHPNTHYIHPATGAALPLPSYYQVPQTMQQQHPYDPQIPMYYMPVRPNNPYNLAPVQPSLGDAAVATATAIPASAGKAVPIAPLPKVVPARAELQQANIYRAAPTAAPTPPAMLPASSPQLIHMPADQAHPYAGMGYQVMQHQYHHHPSQLSAATAMTTNYGYEYAAAADPSHAAPPVYYTQTTSPPAMAPQYQSMATTAVIPDATSIAPQQLQQTGEVKQIRSP